MSKRYSLIFIFIFLLFNKTYAFPESDEVSFYEKELLYLYSNPKMEVSYITLKEAQWLFSGSPYINKYGFRADLYIYSMDNESQKFFVENILKIPYIKFARDISLAKKTGKYIFITKNTKEMIEHLISDPLGFGLLTVYDGSKFNFVLVRIKQDEF
jgi:hypothetical protein